MPGHLRHQGSSILKSIETIAYKAALGCTLGRGEKSAFSPCKCGPCQAETSYPGHGLDYKGMNSHAPSRTLRTTSHGLARGQASFLRKMVPTGSYERIAWRTRSTNDPDIASNQAEKANKRMHRLYSKSSRLEGLHHVSSLANQSSAAVETTIDQRDQDITGR